MAQQPLEPKPVPARRKKKSRRRGRSGLSPFAIMGIVGVVVVLALIAWQVYSAGQVSRNVQTQAANRTLVKPGANPSVSVIEFSDFQ